MNKPLTLSLIIPAYNEARYIGDCLEAVSKQSVMPDEVIVVDNNSTDKTVELAKKYKFVKIIKEPKQGLIAARNRGFNSANGDILARIDADTRLPVNWVAQVKLDFSSDSELSGVTGLGVNYWQSIYSIPSISKAFAWLYFWYIRSYFRVNTLWGANMAIRHSAWGTIKKEVCLDDRLVHEDQDLSLLIAERGGKIRIDSKLTVQFDGSALQEKNIFHEYVQRLHATREYHKQRGAFSSPNIYRVSLPLAIFYRTVTLPAHAFFYVTGLLYTPSTSAYIKKVNRK